MNVSLLTSHEAAELLGVHESSIKRWCDSGALRCRRTAGGHRRIELNSLLDLARNQGIPNSLLAFGSRADELWKALASWRQRGSLADLERLLFEWVVDVQNEHAPILIPYLREAGIPGVDIFDGLITPVMRATGELWERGKMAVGDEHRISQDMFDAIYVLLHEGLINGKNRVPGQKTAIVGCAEGNQHVLGAQMVRYLLLQENWRVIFLGANVPVADLAFQQARYNAALVCVSFSSPQIMADVYRLAGTMAHYYDRNNPYTVAAGGRLSQAAVFEPAIELPFQDIRFFDTSQSFHTWVHRLDDVNV